MIEGPEKKQNLLHSIISDIRSKIIKQRQDPFLDLGKTRTHAQSTEQLNEEHTQNFNSHIAKKNK